MIEFKKRRLAPFKRIVRGILSDPAWKDGNARLTTIPLKL